MGSARASQVVAASHPLALSFAWLIALYASTGTPLWALWRPLAIVVVIVVVIQLGVSAAIRPPARAAWVTSVICMALAAFWLLALPMFAALAWLLMVNAARSRRGRAPISLNMIDRLSMKLGAVSLVLLTLAIGQAGVSGAFWSAAQGRGDSRNSTAHLPDVYLVLLDGYPRGDVLRARFDIDNGTFLSELQSRGFGVAGSSRSNYSTTWLTLASMFQMKYIEEMPEISGVSRSGPSQYRVLGQLLNSAPVLGDLRSHGYKLISSPSAYSDIALTNADSMLATVGPTWLEEELLQKSVAASVAEGLARDWVGEWQREAIETALGRVGAVAGRSNDDPVFMFDHVSSPHPPFVHNADGTAHELQACFPQTCSLRDPSVQAAGGLEDYASGLRGQLEYLDIAVLKMVDQVVARRPDALVILLSDHGTRYDRKDDPREAVSSFFAARTPGAEGLFGDSPSPVNVLPVLLNRYFSEHYATHPYRSWISFATPLDAVPLDR